MPRRAGKRAELRNTDDSLAVKTRRIALDADDRVTSADEHLATRARRERREIGKQQIKHRRAAIAWRRHRDWSEELAFDRVHRETPRIAAGMEDQDTFLGEEFRKRSRALRAQDAACDFSEREHSGCT